MITINAKLRESKAFQIRDKMSEMKCANCGEEIDDEAFKKGVCPKCGQELSYGLEGCGG